MGVLGDCWGWGSMPGCSPVWSLSFSDTCQHNGSCWPWRWGGRTKTSKTCLNCSTWSAVKPFAEGVGACLSSCQHCLSPGRAVGGGPLWERMRVGPAWCCLRRRRREMGETRDVEAARCGASMTMDSCFHGPINARCFTVCPAAGRPLLGGLFVGLSQSSGLIGVGRPDKIASHSRM